MRSLFLPIRSPGVLRFVFHFVLIVAVEDPTMERCRVASVSEGQTGSMEFNLSFIDWSKDTVHLNFISLNDPGTKIFICDRTSCNNDERFEKVKVLDGMLNVRIPHISKDFSGTYVLNTVVNGRPGKRYYCNLDVKLQDETSAKDENPKDPPHTLEDNQKQMVLRVLLGGTLTLLGITFVGITVYCLKYRKKSAKPGEDIVNAEERRRLNQTGLELAVPDGRTPASRGNEASSCLTGQESFLVSQ